MGSDEAEALKVVACLIVILLCLLGIFYDPEEDKED